jgi:hypothetical protein
MPRLLAELHQAFTGDSMREGRLAFPGLAEVREGGWESTKLPDLKNGATEPTKGTEKKISICFLCPHDL